MSHTLGCSWVQERNEAQEKIKGRQNIEKRKKGLAGLVGLVGSAHFLFIIFFLFLNF